MEAKFEVGRLSIERLLKDWLWLCKTPVILIARNAFGDLFLRDEGGRVLKLDVSLGQLTVVAESVEQFLSMARTHEKNQDWFASDDERRFANMGLIPGEEECIAFKIPLVFRESGATPNNPYLGNLYEYVSFLGSIHRQVASLPDGAKVRLRFEKEPTKE
jgi:hypothetical protein